jgi:hypothetical protein
MFRQGFFFLSKNNETSNNPFRRGSPHSRGGLLASAGIAIVVN